MHSSRMCLTVNSELACDIEREEYMGDRDTSGIRSITLRIAAPGGGHVYVNESIFPDVKVEGRCHAVKVIFGGRLKGTRIICDKVCKRSILKVLNIKILIIIIIIAPHENENNLVFTGERLEARGPPSEHTHTHTHTLRKSATDLKNSSFSFYKTKVRCNNRHTVRSELKYTESAHGEHIL